MTRLLGALTATVLLATATARAQPADPSLPTPHLATDILTGGRGPAVSVTTGSSDAPRQLAATYPAAKRAEAERTFHDLLAAYPGVEDRLGVAHGDVAGAMAFYVGAALQSYRGTDIEPAAFRQLLDQLHASIGSSAGFAKATAGERRALYEQLAIIGMIVVAYHHQLVTQPNSTMQHKLQAASKQYLAQLGVNPDRGTVPAAPASPAPASPSPPATPAAPVRSAAAAAAGRIVTVGFISETTMGYGGYVQMTPTPIVLFDGGDALLEMKNLSDPAGIDANKQSHAKAWTKWRKVGNTIERLYKGRWAKLDYTQQYDRLPAHLRLDGQYSMLGGGGNLAVGGDVGIATWKNLAFSRDGRFTTGKGVSLSSRRVAGGSSSAPAGGTYEISGYLLELHVDDGRRVTRAIVADAKDLKAIWIDGDAYTH